MVLQDGLKCEAKMKEKTKEPSKEGVRVFFMDPYQLPIYLSLMNEAIPPSTFFVKGEKLLRCKCKLYNSKAHAHRVQSPFQ